MSRTQQALRIMGLHPLVAFGMVAVDWMLFAGEGAVPVVSWPVSTAVAIALAVPCALVQRLGYKDQWALAIGKALMVGLLTAIPTALPSFFTLGGGILGTTSLILDRGGSAGR